MVLLPGAAHMSRTLSPGPTFRNVTGIIETFSYLKSRPFSVSFTIKRWNAYSSEVLRNSARPISLKLYTVSRVGYQRTGWGTFSANWGIFSISEMNYLSWDLVLAEFSLKKLIDE